MKTKLFLFSTILFLAACSSDSKEGDQAIKLDSTQPQTIAKDSLSAEQIEKIKKIQSTFADVYTISLKETITNFKADPNPADEIGVWENMATAYENYLKSKPTTDLPKKREIFKLILMRSSMQAEEAIKKATLTILTPEESKEVLSFYTQSPVALDSVPVSPAPAKK